MRILIKKATIYQTSSSLHGKKRDILIVNGKIEKIATKIDDNKAKIISSPNLCISAGWVDIGAFNGEPGFEYRETMDSLRAAGAAGGFAKLAVFPNTQPVTDSKQAVQFILRTNQGEVLEILPIAAATVGAKGEDIAELLDFAAGGAVAISDGYKTHLSDAQLKRVLEYIKATTIPYIHMCAGDQIGESGQVNEGVMSVSLGLEGIPAVDEELEVNKLLELASYSKCDNLIVHAISTIDSVHTINNTSESKIFASVPYTHLIFSEQDLKNFDVNLKVLPPLRTNDNRKKLIEAVNKGKLLLITSNHRPRSTEEKDEPFGLSAYGATGIEETFSALVTNCASLELEHMIKALSENSYEALGIALPAIEEGLSACLTIFDPTEKSTLTHKRKSLSKNSPIKSEKLSGKVLGVINNGNSHWS